VHGAMLGYSNTKLTLKKSRNEYDWTRCHNIQHIGNQHNNNQYNELNCDTYHNDAYTLEEKNYRELYWAPRHLALSPST
jgi:hypothetical protein